MMMSAPGPSAIKTTQVLARPIDLRPIPPTLIKREATPRRTKIWEFNTNLHCSIIGTCLSTAELRRVLKKFGMASQDCTDHELHSIAVTLAARHDEPARQLHKALDHQHKLAVNQFARAGTQAALRALWQDAVGRGDIPGAYWATLTHPLTTQAIIREAFGEVHMLSHLIGSANRADIRRLCLLEADKVALETKLKRLQQALHQAVLIRDSQIGELRQALADRIVSNASIEPPANNKALHELVTDREHRLAAEIRRRTTLEDRLQAMRTERDAERAARVAAETAFEALRQELDAIETSLTTFPKGDAETRLENVTLLYVGGRPNQVAPMRTVVERLGATFLHHDGGVENHQNLLPGLASRCDCALFPVDCISHDAANIVKSLCRQANKRFIPLRSASVTSLLAALRAPAVTGMAEAAD
jgi:hypothetical protein